MFTIPLYYILFVYLLFLTVFVTFAVINFYHIVISGSFTFVSFTISFFTFTLTILTLYFTWQLLLDVSWQAPITLFKIDWLNAIFGGGLTLPTQ
jgi:hypothetical protein